MQFVSHIPRIPNLNYFQSSNPIIADGSQTIAECVNTGHSSVSLKAGAHWPEKDAIEHREIHGFLGLMYHIEFKAICLFSILRWLFGWTVCSIMIPFPKKKYHLRFLRHDLLVCLPNPCLLTREIIEESRMLISSRMCAPELCKWILKNFPMCGSPNVN